MLGILSLNVFQQAIDHGAQAQQLRLGKVGEAAGHDLKVRLCAWHWRLLLGYGYTLWQCYYIP